MNTETTTLPDPTRTRHPQYSKFACGHGSPDLYVQVLGLGAGKKAGTASVASMQNSASAHGDWTPSSIALTGANPPATLADLAVCAGSSATEAVGIGSDGRIYRVGSQTQDQQWTPGGGLLPQATTFVPGSLSASLLNTATFFAVTSTQAPWVAGYRDQSQVWQPGYALPGAGGLSFQFLAARPDRSNAGTTHAIGLTTDGKACEVATAVGSGTGVGNWTAGKGRLGSATGLPAFTQLLLVTADSSQNFHVIGLGSDGSVWDIDRYAAGAVTPQWSGQSTRIVAPGSVSGSKIDFFLSGTPTSFTINLVAWTNSTLVVFATFATIWVPASVTIPTSGASRHWQIINNLVDTASNGIFILGLSGAGLLYELAYCKNGTWTAGTQTPIS